MNRSNIRAGLTLALIGAALAGCQQAPRSRATAAATSACRAEVDRVYAAQNRIDLSLRDQRDTPFAGGYNSGITSRGLGAGYARDNQLQSCLANAAGSGSPGIASPGIASPGIASPAVASPGAGSVASGAGTAFKPAAQ